ncbi:ArsR/SmtB family transcription factor [Thalassospira marina]|uniref:Transcriptional regulator n=1 Tax=Thalassospira marina TaxID=2048283 RepID=A0A2N3KJ94_9PROT|nr:metalloregulator ArsR/SmtB family transcription factor [Thalassospira marina]AUG51594.1 transcriptional regulator [Thalassospira marina]PKR50576.1 transcriptional regulator [Thalassospira marina]
MDTNEIIDAFTALSQITRLEAFRLLVRHEPEGLPAGELARLLDVPHNTMSAHLGVLSRSGLITSKRQGRSIIYRASLTRMNDMLGFMVNDCCAGHPELCQPIALTGVAPASCKTEPQK